MSMRSDVRHDFEHSTHAALSALGDGTARRRRTLSLVQGGLNIATGLWPVVHPRSFEAITGRRDARLAKTVGPLLGVIGGAQVTAADRETTSTAPDAVGIGTAAVLLAIDVISVARGRISKVYLLRAATQVAFLAAWARARSAQMRAA